MAALLNENDLDEIRETGTIQVNFQRFPRYVSDFGGNVLRD